MTKNSDKQAILIAGPTASGKSGLALKVAEATGGTIINADAMQVYADLRILTARPSLADEHRIAHKLYGHIEATQRYSVGKWLQDIQPVLDIIWKSGVPAIIVGGTGLYFKALEEGLSLVPEISAERRAALSQELETTGIAGLYQRLQQCDRESAQTLEPTDAQRIIRALEVIEETGIALGEWQRRKQNPVLEGCVVARGHLGVDRDILYERCNARLAAMVDEGALEEVEHLQGLNLNPQLPVMKAIGVREFSAYLKGDINLKGAVSGAQMQTRRYAKRQMTWFRGQMKGWPSGAFQEILPQLLK